MPKVFLQRRNFHACDLRAAHAVTCNLMIEPKPLTKNGQLTHGLLRDTLANVCATATATSTAARSASLPGKDCTQQNDQRFADRSRSYSYLSRLHELH